METTGITLFKYSIYITCFLCIIWRFTTQYKPNSQLQNKNELLKNIVDTTMTNIVAETVTNSNGHNNVIDTINSSHIGKNTVAEEQQINVIENDEFVSQNHSQNNMLSINTLQNHSGQKTETLMGTLQEHNLFAAIPLKYPNLFTLPTQTEMHKYKFEHLPSEYIPCLNNESMIDSNCELPHNISFIKHAPLGRGAYATTFDVAINNNHNINNDYVLKTGNRKCNLFVNYNVLKWIQNYTNYYNMSNSLFNMPYIHPFIPAYLYSDNCLLFIHKVLNAISLKSFKSEQTMKQLLPFLTQQQSNILNFSINCFNDIMNVFLILSKINLIHNDLTSSNIMIDQSTFKCYLIDYGMMLRLKNFPIKVGPHVKWKCLQHCSSTLGRNVLFKRNYLSLNNSDFVRYAMYEKQYEIATYIFHTFIELYRIQNNIDINDELFRLNKLIIESEKQKHTHFQYRRFEIQWCRRYEIVNLFKKHNIYAYVNSFEKNYLGEQFLNVMDTFQIDQISLDTNKCKQMLKARLKHIN